MFADAIDVGLGLIDLLSLLAVPALMALNGLFVAAEFSLVALRQTRVEEMVQQGVKGARAIQNALKNINRSIAATQLGITLASIALGFVGEPALEHLIHPLFSWLTPEWQAFVSHPIGWTLAFILITLMHVVFGELIPKTLALRKPERTALWLARPLLIFTRLTRPLVLLADGAAGKVLRWLGSEVAGNESRVHSVEELLLLIEDTEEAGILDPDQADYIENLFRLSNKKVKDCLLPREKMAALELNTPPEKILEAVRSGAHTRMPVYDGEIDKIVGIVNTKDLFYLFSLRGVVILQDALYPAMFLEPDVSMSTALRLFRKSKRPMALVRDDLGHIMGLITLEDVLEEIIGDIEDEHDQPSPRLVLRRRADRPGSKSSIILRDEKPRPG